jgi:hypothetical protein
MQPQVWMLEKYACEDTCYRDSIGVDVVDMTLLIIRACLKLPLSHHFFLRVTQASNISPLYLI